MSRALWRADIPVLLAGQTGLLPHLLSGVQWTAYQHGTTTPVTGAWDAETGGNALTWPQGTDANGQGTLWLDTPQRVDISVTAQTVSGLTLAARTRTVDVGGALDPVYTTDATLLPYAGTVNVYRAIPTSQAFTVQSLLQARHVNASTAAAGGAIAAILGSADISAGTLDHIIGVAGHTDPTTAGATYAFGVEGHAWARNTAGIFVCGTHGTATAGNLSSNNGSTLVGVMGEVSAVTDPGTAAAVAGLFRVQLPTLGSWAAASAYNAIFGQGASAGENWPISLRGYSSLTGNTGEAAANWVITDLGAGAGAYLLLDASDAKLAYGVLTKVGTGANVAWSVQTSASTNLLTVTATGLLNGPLAYDLVEAAAPGAAPAASTHRLFANSANGLLQEEAHDGTIADVSHRIHTKAGAVVAADVPAGTCSVWRDTTNNTTKLCANYAGTLYTVALS